LFPIYASLITPPWLRLLGARVGRRVEASTVIALPHLIRLADGSFLADDARLAAATRSRRGRTLRATRLVGGIAEVAGRQAAEVTTACSLGRPAGQAGVIDIDP
jgi:hypothetical protein